MMPLRFVITHFKPTPQKNPIQEGVNCGTLQTIIRFMDLFSSLVVVYFAGLGLAMVFRKKTRSISGPWLFLFRAFFPNWQFFHGLGPAPRLWVRSQGPDGQWSDWRLHYPRMTRHPLQWLYNPVVNLALSHQNLVEHLASDIHALPENGDIRSFVSYQLVTRLARQAVMENSTDVKAIEADLPPDLLSFQFEVRLMFLANNQTSMLLQSPVMPWTT